MISGEHIPGPKLAP